MTYYVSISKELRVVEFNTLDSAQEFVKENNEEHGFWEVKNPYTGDVSWEGKGCESPAEILEGESLVEYLGVQE